MMAAKSLTDPGPRAGIRRKRPSAPQSPDPPVAPKRRSHKGRREVQSTLDDDATSAALVKSTTELVAAQTEIIALCKGVFGSWPATHWFRDLGHDPTSGYRPWSVSGCHSCALRAKTLRGFPARPIHFEIRRFPDLTQFDRVVTPDGRLPLWLRAPRSDRYRRASASAQSDMRTG
jgi:hypothetical protein